MGAQKRKPVDATGATPESKKVATWSVDDATAYLQRLDLGRLEECIRDNGVDGLMMQELSGGDHVQLLGLTPLQAKKVRQRLP